MDSDNLKDLGALFDTVRADTELLVVLCTTLVLTRPWCVGEVTVSCLNAVKVMPVILPDFVLPMRQLL